MFAKTFTKTTFAALIVTLGTVSALPAFASGRLTLHSADLDQPGCFDTVFHGCDGVAHVSHVSTYDDAEYVQRTCDHIIASVE